MKSSLKSPVTKVQKVEVFKLEMIPNETDTSSAIFFWQDSKCLEPILCQETSWFLEDRTASLTFCYSKESIYTLCCYAQKKTHSPYSIINLRYIENIAAWKQWRESSGFIWKVCWLSALYILGVKGKCSARVNTTVFLRSWEDICA